MVECSSVADAMAKLSYPPPHATTGTSSPWLAFVFDLSLRDGSGWELVAEARKHHDSVRRILLTATFSEEVHSRAWEEGCDYVLKMESKERLQTLIRSELIPSNGAAARARLRHAFMAREQELHAFSDAETLLLESVLANLRPRLQLDGHIIGYQTIKTHKSRIFEKVRALKRWEFVDWEDLCRVLRVALEEYEGD